MNNSNQITSGKLKTLRILKALITAGLYASIFLPVFIFLMFCIILTVGGGNDFTNMLVNLSEKILKIPLKMLNLDEGGGLFPASFFWSLVLYAIIFLRVYLFARIEPMDETGAAKKYSQMQGPAIWSLIYVLMSLIVLVSCK